MPLTANWMALVDGGHLSVRRLANGEMLFRQGDRATAIYVVKEGRIRLIRHLEDGSSVALYVARPGDSFAEASLWAEAYHCDSVADGPSAVTVIPKPNLLRVLETNPQSAMSLARALAAQVRSLRSSLELRNIRSARQRVLAWLRLEAVGSPPVVELDRPWTRIADEIGLTHEALYCTLAALQTDGSIIRSRRQIRLVMSPVTSDFALPSKVGTALNGKEDP